MPAEDPRRSEAMARAVEAFLRACGLDPTHKDLVGTPQRVAKVWEAEFLVGYTMDPAEILADPVIGEGETNLVIVRDLPFHGMCPHHLLPYVGRATVAYLPGSQLLGFGRLADLVRCVTHRFTLQERACNDVVDALMQYLDARGAGCVMLGEHACLRIPEQRHAAQVMTTSFRGAFEDRADLQSALFTHAASPAPHADA